MIVLLVALLILTNAATFGLLVWLFSAKWIDFANLPPLDVANLALVAATLVVAGVGIVVAVVTFVGYRDIKSASVKAARAAANTTAADVAQVVATRVARETRPSETTSADAAAIAAAAAGPVVVDAAGWTGQDAGGNDGD